MCDPITIGMAALGGAAALFGGGKDAAPPPPVINPNPTSTAQSPGAVVKVGDGATDNSTPSTPTYDTFATKRATGKPLGGLGKGGLGL